MTTVEWIGVVALACGPLLAFFAGAELRRNRHDLRARRTSEGNGPQR